MKYRTDIERIMESELKKEGIDYSFDFPVNCKWGYRIDFALPEFKIAIECDGERWHPKKSDPHKDKILKERGWIVLRFWGKEIVEETNKCMEIIKNHIP